jgi:hypothetical protein
MTDQVLTQPSDYNQPVVHKSYLFTGMAVKLIRRWYSDANTLPAGLEARLWTPNSSTTKLRLESRYDILGHEWEARPAIVVRENSLQSHRIGIGEGRLSLYKPDLANWHNTMYVGSHTVLCCSATEAESRLLALETQQLFQRFQHHIRHGICMLRLRINDVGQTKFLKEARQIFATPFTIGYAFDEPFSVFPIAPRIRFIDINTRTE